MKRARPPFSLLAYGNNHACRLTGMAEHRTELIAIGANAARLRLPIEATSSLRLGEYCLLNVEAPLDVASAEGIPCRVAWMNGREAGVDFSIRINASILALQMVMERGQLAREEAA